VTAATTVTTIDPAGIEQRRQPEEGRTSTTLVPRTTSTAG
jgi:hypothetical protein